MVKVFSPNSEMSDLFDNCDFSADDSTADPDFMPEMPSRKRKLHLEEPSPSKIPLTDTLPASSIFCSEFYTEVKKVTHSGKVSPEGKCSGCGRIIKAAGGVTSNFVKHMRVRHRELFDKYRVVKTGKSDSQTAQQTFDKKIIFAIVDCGLPVCLLERLSFRESYEATGLKVPSRQTAMMILQGQYDSMLDKVRSDIASAKYFCTTADIWSGNHRSFLGYTCHWSNDKLERKSAALACRRLTGTHSSEKLMQVITDINSSFELNSSNVVMTVTDNGSNFVKAFKEHGVSLDMDDIDIDLPQFENECLLPKHQRCASHTLNLLATTDFMKILKSNA